jgi:exonuclease 3'-5' domain-containing protein 1
MAQTKSECLTAGKCMNNPGETGIFALYITLLCTSTSIYFRIISHQTKTPTTTMARGMTFIDNKKDLEVLLDSITTSSSDNNGVPQLYLDLEGTKVSRNGTLALLTVMIHPQVTTYIIDITSLGKTAFSTKDSSGKRDLKSILESENIGKVFYDVRRDSDALYAHFGVRLAGVHDLQLMQVAARPKHVQKHYLTGLGKCIQYDAELSNASRIAADAIKEKGIKLFDPKKGGSYAVFDARPLSEDIKKYCVQDVQFMPKLWAVYRGKMSEFWWNEVLKETKGRIQLSQKEDWEPHGPNMGLAPSHWAGLKE